MGWETVKQRWPKSYSHSAHVSAGGAGQAITDRSAGVLGCVGRRPGQVGAWCEPPMLTSYRGEQSQDTESFQETPPLGYSNSGSGFPKPFWTELLKQ